MPGKRLLLSAAPGTEPSASALRVFGRGGECAPRWAPPEVKKRPLQRRPQRANPGPLRPLPALGGTAAAPLTALGSETAPAGEPGVGGAARPGGAPLPPAASQDPGGGKRAPRGEGGGPVPTPVPYQLLLQGGEGGLQPVLLAVGGQGLRSSARRRPLRHVQGCPHQLPLLLPQHLELLEAGQGRLQPLAHPAAIPAARPRGAQQHRQRWASIPAMATGGRRRRGSGGAAPAPGRACGEGRPPRSAAGGGASAAGPRRPLRFWRRGGDGGGKEEKRAAAPGSAGTTSRGGGEEPAPPRSLRPAWGRPLPGARRSGVGGAALASSLAPAVGTGAVPAVPGARVPIPGARVPVPAGSGPRGRRGGGSRPLAVLRTKMRGEDAGRRELAGTMSAGQNGGLGTPSLPLTADVSRKAGTPRLAFQKPTEMGPNRTSLLSRTESLSVVALEARQRPVLRGQAVAQPPPRPPKVIWRAQDLL